jgi:hypothetical protein
LTSWQRSRAGRPTSFYRIVAATAALLAGFAGAWVASTAGPQQARADACIAGTGSQAAAMALAQACGRQVEALDARTETDQVFAQADGTLRLERRSRPVRVRTRDGAWAPVDTFLRFASGGAVVPGATPVGLVFSGGGTGPLVQLNSAGHRLDVGSPFGVLPKPVLDGSSAIYPDVLPGVDLRVNADSEGFTEVVVVKSRDAAKNPALRRISFPFSGPGLRTTADETGNLRVTDASGAVVFGGAPPSMWDSSPASTPGAAAGGAHDHTLPPNKRHGERMPVEVTATKAEVDGSLVSITPSQDFLLDPDTVYPVLIDPPVTRYKLGWTYVSADCGTCTFWNDASEAQTGPLDGHTHRSFFRMPLDSFRNLNIISSQFVIDLKYVADTRYWKETGLWVTNPISGSTSWNNQPTQISFLGYLTLNAPTNGVTWDLTNTIRYAIGQSWPDLTLGLYSRSDTDYAYGKRWSNNPAVVVQYNNTPSVPVVEPFTECSSSCTSPAVVRTLTPTFRVKVSDPDGGQLRADFEIRRNNETALLATASSGPVSSGSIAAWTINAGVLQDPGSYLWRARARDEPDWRSEWTSWQSVIVNTRIEGQVTVSSTEYPEDAWGAPVGTRGTFRFSHLPPVDSNNPTAPRISTVTAFRWIVEGETGVNEVAATRTPGCTTQCAATATVTYTPSTDMGKLMVVYAVNGAGSTTYDTYYAFTASPLPNRCWRWMLDDASGGNAEDTGNTDPNDEICGPIGTSVTPSHGYLNGGVTWGSQPGAAPRDHHAHFDGVSGEIYTDGSVINATASFTVMAWVRAADLTGRYQTLLSQPGASVDQFALRYNKDANNGAGGWCFDKSSRDATGSTVSVCATGTVGDSVRPTVGQWVHLAGVYDSTTGRIQIHVMGNQDSCNGEMVTASITGSWAMDSFFEIGLSYAGWSNSNAFKGDIDQVYAFQRALAPSEICRQV